MGFAENALSLVTVTNVFLGLVAYVIFKAVSQIIHYRFFHPLKDFPGPFWASVTRLWIAKQNLQETEYLTAHELTKKYGDLDSQLTVNCRTSLTSRDPRPRRSNYPNIAAGQRPLQAARSLPPECRQDRTLHHR